MAETELAIHNRMLSTITDDYDKEDGSFIYDATKPPAIEFATIQTQIEKVEKKLDVMNLIGDDLTNFVYARTGIKRKTATYATGQIKVIGAAGTVIGTDDIASTPMNVLYSFSNDTMIDESGIAMIEVICQSIGAVGNTAANTITILPASIDGVISITNPIALSNGYNEESDEELRERYFDKLQRPGKAGNKYHFEEWAKSVVGVGDARCVPRYNGPLSVKVIIIDGNRLPANDTLIAETRRFIEQEMPFGVVDLSVVSATPIAINVQADLQLLSNYDEQTVIATIQINLSAYLKTLAFNADAVSYAKIGALIIESEGVADYENLLVNGNTANIEIYDDQVAVVGGVNE